MSQEKERLLARKQKIEQRLADLEKEAARRREKDEERKAALAGRAVLKHARGDADFAARLRAVLDAEITGVRQRALFDLPARSAAARPGAAPPDSAVAAE